MVILNSMKTAISIPDSLFLAAEEFARRLGISRSELYQNAVRALIEQHREREVTERLNSVYKGEDAAGRLDPLLEKLQGASLAAEDWE